MKNLYYVFLILFLLTHGINSSSQTTEAQKHDDDIPVFKVDPFWPGTLPSGVQTGKRVQKFIRKNAGEEQGSLKLVEVKKNWDKAPHNAFTDLIRYKGEWLCTFREAKNHWGPGAHGKIRIISSTDGAEWHSVTLMTQEGDLRDPKLCITPDNKLMLLCYRRFNPPRTDIHEQSFVYFSSDGREWTEPVEVGYHDSWLWRVTWHNGKAYGISYHKTEQENASGDPYRGLLLISDDGKKFTLHSDIGHGGESTIRFDKDGKAYCLLRTTGNALLGQAEYPYRDWSWKDTGFKFGGPEMIILPDGRILAAGRLYEGKTRTSLGWIDPRSGKLTEVVQLPSGGDTSYPGLVLHDGLLWVSYYSSHEGKTSIYLAKVRIE
jgi:hypothetical protein